MIVSIRSGSELLLSSIADSAFFYLSGFMKKRQPHILAARTHPSTRVIKLSYCTHITKNCLDVARVEASPFFL